jgi:uncharacterized Zn finger protein
VKTKIVLSCNECGSQFHTQEVKDTQLIVTCEKCGAVSYFDEVRHDGTKVSEFLSLPSEPKDEVKPWYKFW